MIIFLLNYIHSFFFQIILSPPSFLSYTCTSCFFISSYSYLLDFHASTCNLIFSSSHQFYFLWTPFHFCFFLLHLPAFPPSPSPPPFRCPSCFYFLFLFFLLSLLSFFFLLFLLHFISSSFSITPSFYFSFLFLFLFYNLFLLFFLTRGSNASETSECRIGLHRKKR